MNGPKRLIKWTLIAAPLVLIATPLVVAAVFVIHLWMTAGTPPALAGNARMTFGMPSKEWTERLNEKFPTGTPESTVIATLRHQGFQVDTSNRSAKYQWGNGFPCLYFLSADWFVDANSNVAGMWGNFSNSCL